MVPRGRGGPQGDAWWHSQALWPGTGDVALAIVAVDGAGRVGRAVGDAAEDVAHVHRVVVVLVGDGDQLLAQC